jgi:hypothetical protein
LDKISVKQDKLARGAGYGKTLLDFAIANLLKPGLSVHIPTARSAAPFFKKCGFEYFEGMLMLKVPPPCEGAIDLPPVPQTFAKMYCQQQCNKSRDYFLPMDNPTAHATLRKKVFIFFTFERRNLKTRQANYF